MKSSSSLINAPQWTFDDFTRLRTNFTYRGADACSLYELKTTDLSNTFLVCHGTLNFETYDSTDFGIEASRTCPFRQAFEWGHMSWIDYWFHKGIALELSISARNCEVHSKFVTPDKIDPTSLTIFEHNGYNGPYVLLRKQLKASINIAKFKGEDAIKEEHEYLNFMSLHGHRFTDQAA